MKAKSRQRRYHNGRITISKVPNVSYVQRIETPQQTITNTRKPSEIFQTLMAFSYS